MTWARLDDHANEHKKQLKAGAEACWLWSCGLMYANRQRARDGFIPDEALLMLYPFKSPEKLANKLVSVGLWVKVDGGYQIHEYANWNDSAEKLENKREQTRERMRRLREERKRGDATDSDACDGVTSVTVTQSGDASVLDPLHSTPLQERNPPPLSEQRSARPDPFGDSLRGQGPGDRADVRKLFEAFKAQFGFVNMKFRNAFDENAKTLAAAIDLHTLETCERVLAHSPTDGMVSGRGDERRAKHDTIRYIFGNDDAFQRILRAAVEAERAKPGGGASFADALAAHRQRRTGDAA